MKKIIVLLLNIILAVFLLAGCSKYIENKKEDPIVADEKDNLNEDNEKNQSNDKNSEETKLSFKDELLKLNLRMSPYSEDREATQTEWIKKWLEFTYKDTVFKNLKTKDVSHHYKFINDDLSLKIEKVFIQFDSDNKLDNIKVNEEGNYSSQVYMIFAEKMDEGQTYYYYLDIINNQDYNNIDIFEYALSVLDNDDRFGKNLDIISMFNKENVLTNDVALFDADKFLTGYHIHNIGKREDKLLLIMKQPSKIDENGNLLNNIKLCSYDYDTKEITEIFEVKNIESNYFSYYEDKGITYSDGKNSYMIDFEGKISIIDKNQEEYIYSPDKKHYAYSDEDRNLIIKNTESKETVIKLESLIDENQAEKLSDLNAYNAYSWFDNENFIYIMTGYEWSNGFGIVNINTMENIVLDDSPGKRIHKLIDKKLGVYTYSGYGETFPFKFGHYDLDKIPYTYHEDYDAKNYPEVYETESGSEFWRIFSSDMSHLYIFGYNYEKFEYFVKIFSVKDEKLTKETRFKPSEYLPSEYIMNSVVLNDKILIIYDRNNIYFIEL